MGLQDDCIKEGVVFVDHLFQVTLISHFNPLLIVLRPASVDLSVRPESQISVSQLNWLHLDINHIINQIIFASKCKKYV